ncbi:MAG: hypothetical protein LBE09_07235, partial [Christensenellaceae bacterium]|nr:hypothetical protein [Christensenellaceae bacterium]
MKKVFIIIAVCILSVSIYGCNQSDDIFERRYTFEIQKLTAIVDYEILLDEYVNTREIRVPFVFKFELINETPSVDVIAVKDENGNNIDMISYEVVALSFSLDDEDKYIIGNLDLAFRLVGSPEFTDIYAKSLLIELDGKQFQTDINIVIRNRKSFGIYENLQATSLASQNIGGLNVVGPFLEFGYGVQCNRDITLLSVAYPDGEIITDFKLSKFFNKEETVIDIADNLNLNVPFMKLERATAHWVFDEGEWDNNTYFGREVIFRYRDDATKEEYID